MGGIQSMTEQTLRLRFRAARRPESLGLDSRIMELDRQILALTVLRDALKQQQGDEPC